MEEFCFVCNIVNYCFLISQPMLDPVIHNMIKYVQNVEEKDLKDKVELD